jgi:hypothetical protein
MRWSLTERGRISECRIQGQVHKSIIRRDQWAEEVRYLILISRYPYHYIRSFKLHVTVLLHVLATLFARAAEPAGDAVLGLLGTLRTIVSKCAIKIVMTPRLTSPTFLSNESTALFSSVPVFLIVWSMDWSAFCLYASNFWSTLCVPSRA